jgi:hypothetical protein
MKLGEYVDMIASKLLGVVCTKQTAISQPFPDHSLNRKAVALVVDVLVIATTTLLGDRVFVCVCVCGVHAFVCARI